MISTVQFYFMPNVKHVLTTTCFVCQAAYKNKTLPTYTATLPAFEAKKRAMMVRIWTRVY
jgi:hypothetical protein